MLPRHSFNLLSLILSESEHVPRQLMALWLFDPLGDPVCDVAGCN